LLAAHSRQAGWALSAVGLLVAASTGCASSFGVDCTDELRIRPIPVDTTIAVGEHFGARVALSTCGGKRQLDDTYTWSSEDTHVVTIDPVSGVATAVGVGQTRIVATGATYRAFGGTLVTVR